METLSEKCVFAIIPLIFVASTISAVIFRASFGGRDLYYKQEKLISLYFRITCKLDGLTENVL
jgi:hypothetical protein